MKTQEFLNLLKSQQDKSLLFEYSPGMLVQANYHITEVKHIKVDSVDCGATSDSWNETIVQLWESPSEIGKTKFMTVYKATSIVNKVGRMKAYDMDSEIKFEYGNPHFHTTQLSVFDYELRERQLILKLSTTKTDCKAKEQCGIPVTAEASEQACCDPASGCC